MCFSVSLCWSTTWLCKLQHTQEMPPKELVWNKTNRMVVIRRSIQHEYLRLLNEGGFGFGRNAKEPFGIQSKVVTAVNNQFYGPTRMRTNRQTVSDWTRRVRENAYEVTACWQDYSKSRKNPTKFGMVEQKRIRDCSPLMSSL